MSESTKIKSFDYAIDLTKQIITLASVLVGITLTFFDKFKWSESIWLLHGSWYLFFISIVSGIFLIMKLTGEMSEIDKGDNLNAFNFWSVLFSIVQLVTFGIALVFLIFYAKDFDGKKDNIPVQLIEKHEITTKSYEYHCHCVTCN
jgi:hypothetical protein